MDPNTPISDVVVDAPVGEAATPVTEPVAPAQVVDTPAEPVVPPVADPEPTFRLPGEYQQPNETDWYRQNYSQALEQAAALQRQLDELQFQNMSEEEVEREMFRREREQWQQQMQTFQQQQAVTEWRNYWAQFAENPEVIRQQTDPIQMGHQVVTSLHQQLKAARAEIAALKKAAGTPVPGPAVTTGAAGAAPRQSLMSLSRNEREALYKKARMGLISEGDFPTI